MVASGLGWVFRAEQVDSMYVVRNAELGLAKLGVQYRLVAV